MDADLQHPPEMLPQLIEKWNEGYDIVYTIRKDIVNVSRFKKVTAALFYRLMNYLSDIEVKPGSADFRLVDRKIVEILIHDITEYHLFYRDIIIYLLKQRHGMTAGSFPGMERSRIIFFLLLPRITPYRRTIRY